MRLTHYQLETQRRMKAIFNKFDNRQCMFQEFLPSGDVIECHQLDGKLVMFFMYGNGGFEYYLQGNEMEISNIGDDIKNHFSR